MEKNFSEKNIFTELPEKEKDYKISQRIENSKSGLQLEEFLREVDINSFENGEQLYDTYVEKYGILGTSENMQKLFKDFILEYFDKCHDIYRKLGIDGNKNIEEFANDLIKFRIGENYRFKGDYSIELKGFTFFIIFEKREDYEEFFGKEKLRSNTSRGCYLSNYKYKENESNDENIFDIIILCKEESELGIINESTLNQVQAHEEQHLINKIGLFYFFWNDEKEDIEWEPSLEISRFKDELLAHIKDGRDYLGLRNFLKSSNYQKELINIVKEHQPELTERIYEILRELNQALKELDESNLFLKYNPGFLVYQIIDLSIFEMPEYLRKIIDYYKKRNKSLGEVLNEYNSLHEKIFFEMDLYLLHDRFISKPEFRRNEQVEEFKALDEKIKNILNYNTFVVRDMGTDEEWKDALAEITYLIEELHQKSKDILINGRTPPYSSEIFYVDQEKEKYRAVNNINTKKIKTELLKNLQEISKEEIIEIYNNADKQEYDEESGEIPLQSDIIEDAISKAFLKNKYDDEIQITIYRYEDNRLELEITYFPEEENDLVYGVIHVGMDASE